MIGDKILALRKSLNLSQKELCEKIGITEASLSRYENNLREPKGDIIAKLAKALNTSTDYLLDDQNNLHSKNNLSKLPMPEIPEQFTDPDLAREYVAKHKIFGANGFRPDLMSDEKILEFANALLEQMELLSYKYKK